MATQVSNKTSGPQKRH